MEAKYPWASKTVWVNAIAFVAAATGAFGVDLGLTPETQTALVGGIMAVVNILLRLITRSPVTLTKGGTK